VGEPCPMCGAPFLTERYARGGKVTRACIREECGYKQEILPTVVA
jgi:ssDNA-binding Zn-finger/Zn-ribbon topoisomerase 1